MSEQASDLYKEAERRRRRGKEGEKKQKKAKQRDKALDRQALLFFRHKKNETNARTKKYASQDMT